MKEEQRYILYECNTWRWHTAGISESIATTSRTLWVSHSTKAKQPDGFEYHHVSVVSRCIHWQERWLFVVLLCSKRWLPLTVPGLEGWVRGLSWVLVMSPSRRFTYQTSHQEVSTCQFKLVCFVDGNVLTISCPHKPDLQRFTLDQLVRNSISWFHPQGPSFGSPAWQARDVAGGDESCFAVVLGTLWRWNRLRIGGSSSPKHIQNPSKNHRKQVPNSSKNASKTHPKPKPFPKPSKSHPNRPNPALIRRSFPCEAEPGDHPEGAEHHLQR